MEALQLIAQSAETILLGVGAIGAILSFLVFKVW
jgi:Na+-transporting methylmalonyl-CoA/oxaloacetate decarboxylase gamma subunit